MKLAIAALSATLSFLAPAAMTQTNEEVMLALGNLQHEMSRCVGYFKIVETCVRAQDPQVAEKYLAAGNQLTQSAVVVGETIGMTGDAMTSRILLEQAQMQDLLGSCVNIDSLLIRYAERCKQVVENSDSIIAEYLDKTETPTASDLDP